MREQAEHVARLLVARGETISIAEGSCGGLISSELLAVPGASAYFVAGTVIYTPTATRAFVSGTLPTPAGLRGATEQFALYLARSMAAKCATTWAIGEGGAAGPSGNPYGDPPGHAWVAVAGRSEATRHVLTGSADRRANMTSFAIAALELLLAQLEAS
jgi:PncC family amidohydrolase